MNDSAMTTEELEELINRQRSAAKLTKALSAEPAPPETLLDAWVELKVELLYICQEGKERAKSLKSKLPPDEFLPCGDNQVKLVTHRAHRSFSMDVIFEPEARRIRWHSGRRVFHCHAG